VLQSGSEIFGNLFSIPEIRELVMKWSDSDGGLYEFSNFVVANYKTFTQDKQCETVSAYKKIGTRIGKLWNQFYCLVET